MRRAGPARLALHPRVRVIRRVPTNVPLLVYPERALELNDSALEIVELLDGERTLGGIVEQLGERHPEISRQRLHAAVVFLVNELTRRALIQTLP
jgi:coenzyme PQQ biosynthesis protein PqqD